ncbi:MAG: OadG family transporter subunit [Bacteroidales bacterium]
MLNKLSKGFKLAALSLLFTGSLSAQQAIYLRLNEVMPNNVDNYQDDYGKQSAWIEIFNNSPATVDLGGCFLTTDINNPTMYPIPKGDILTKVKARQHIIFWADNNPSHGTFHLNFALDSVKPNFIAIFDSNGKTLIDSITIPPIGPDQSFARVLDGSGAWALAEKVTPSTNNKILTGQEAVLKFKENDPTGVGMAITAMMVVFFALIVLYVVFKCIGNTAMRISKRNALKAQKGTVVQKPVDLGTESGEVFAAIAMALHEYNNEAHDLENTVLTINRVTRNYSPWNSKIYGLKELPKKR